MDPDYNAPAAAPVAAPPMVNINHLMVPQGSMSGPNEATTARFTPLLDMRKIIKSAREKPFHSLADFDLKDKIGKQAADAGKKRLEENKRKKSREPTMAPPRFDVVKRITEIRTLIQIYKDNLEIWKDPQDNQTIKYYKEKIMNLEKERGLLMKNFLKDSREMICKNKEMRKKIEEEIATSKKNQMLRLRKRETQKGHGKSRKRGRRKSPFKKSLFKKKRTKSLFKKKRTKRRKRRGYRGKSSKRTKRRGYRGKSTRRRRKS